MFVPLFDSRNAGLEKVPESDVFDSILEEHQTVFRVFCNSMGFHNIKRRQTREEKGKALFIYARPFLISPLQSPLRLLIQQRLSSKTFLVFIINDFCLHSIESKQTQIGREIWDDSDGGEGKGLRRPFHKFIALCTDFLTLKQITKLTTLSKLLFIPAILEIPPRFIFRGLSFLLSSLK
jgi:hypothetical protein